MNVAEWGGRLRAVPMLKTPVNCRHGCYFGDEGGEEEYPDYDAMARLVESYIAATAGAHLYQEQEIERLRGAIRDLLGSADASWEETESDMGHDWAVACQQARSALVAKGEGA